MKTILQSFRLLLLLTILTGIAYPVAIFLIGKAVAPSQAGGSLVFRDGKAIGSKWLAQKFENPRYFHPRPSAADYATVPSGASNLGPTSKALKTTIAERRAQLGPDASSAPVEMLTASASGLDPHLSPEAAIWQIRRIAAARQFSPEQAAMLEKLVAKQTEPPQFGLLGEARINVLTLNLALDELKK